MKKYALAVCILVLLLFVSVEPSVAQCALCKQSAETSLAEGKKDAAGLNTGIIYLLSIPYILVGGIGYAWYRKRKKLAQEQGEEI